MKWTHALITLFFAGMLLSGCNKTEDPKPMDSPVEADSAMPKEDAGSPTPPAPAPAAEPAKEEPGGWTPPAEGS